MHPLTCYDGQISLCHAKFEKISSKIFVMINKDGGDNFWNLWGDTELMGVPPLGKTLMCQTTRLPKFVTSRPVINIRIFYEL